MPNEKNEGAVTLTPAQLQEIITSAVTAAVTAARPDPAAAEELMRKQAKINAEERQKLDERDNRNFPDTSIFNPGGKADPKPPLAAKAVTWGGTDVLYDLTTRTEVELLNQLRPGYYQCEKSDGTKFRVTVSQKANDITGAIERMDVAFVTAGKGKDNLPSMTIMLRDMLSQQEARSAAPLVGALG